MASLGKQEWNGVSGKYYTYEVFDIRFNPNPDQYGNYIFAKQLPNGWKAVYIGEGDLEERLYDEDHRSCALEKGATHVHCHLTKSKQAGESEEEDLLAMHTEAYTPTGCNIKPGG